MLLIFIVFALAGLLAAILLMWKYPVEVTGTVVVAAGLADLTGLGASGLHLGVLIYPLDIACVALIACCIIVCLQTRSLPRDFSWAALILLGLGVLNFTRGILVVGVKPAGNIARGLIHLILPAVAFSALGGAIRMTVERVVTCLSLASLALAVLAVAIWTGMLPMADVEDFREIARPLPAEAAMIIGQALIGVLGIQLIRGFRTTGLIMAGVFAGLVFALQHRSVWTATMAGLVWLALRSPRLARREWLKFSSMILCLAALLPLAPLLAPGPFERALNMARSNVEEVGQEDSTWAWRVEGYSEATQRVFSNGLTEALIGPPSGLDRSNTASFASIFIHDRYISVLAYYGVTGLAVLTFWLFATGARIQRLASMASKDRQARIEKVILEAIFISVLVFFVPYSGAEAEGSLLGILWLASAARRAGDDDSAAVHRQSTVLEYSLRTAPPRTAMKNSRGLRFS